MKWDKERHNELVALKQKGLSWRMIAEQMTAKYDHIYTPEQCRGRWRTNRHLMENEPTYKETVEIKSDGSHHSDKLIQMSAEQSKDVNFLLTSHGYDIDEWELVSARSNIWNTNDKQSGIQTLFASKITVKPKTTGFNFDKLLEAIEKRKPLKPIQFKGKPTSELYLNIPFFDLHFGNNTLQDYKQTLQDTIGILETTYEEVLFIIGQDMLHNDGFKGQTANGTQIDKVDMEKAWDDADEFYTRLITKALEKSQRVSVMYIKGNHDENMSWSFVRMLEKTFKDNPRIMFDTRFKERKAYLLGGIFIGSTHGDKGRKNLAANFSVEFPQYWAQSTTREVYIGHLHRKRTTQTPIELTNDANGLIVRELGTGNKIDDYHDDNGYTMAHREFEIFEYTKTRKKCIYYV